MHPSSTTFKLQPTISRNTDRIHFKPARVTAQLVCAMDTLKMDRL